MVFRCVKDFLDRRRSVNPAQAWTNSILPEHALASLRVARRLSENTH